MGYNVDMTEAEQVQQQMIELRQQLDRADLLVEGLQTGLQQLDRLEAIARQLEACQKHSERVEPSVSASPSKDVVG